MQLSFVRPVQPLPRHRLLVPEFFLSSEENDVSKEPPITVSSEDRLSNVAFVLLVQTFSEFDNFECPFVDVQLEVLKDPCCLSPLPLGKI
jgi:hypothetical protein